MSRIAGLDGEGDMTEQEKAELLDLIAGRGKWAWSSQYLHTYPDDPGINPSLHAMCLELETEGKIVGKEQSPGHWCWQIKE